MPTFTYRTRMLTRCPDCGADVCAIAKHDPRTTETVLICPACGGEMRRTALQERDTAEENLRPN